MTGEQPRCSADSYKFLGWSRCENRGKYLIDGKWYCGTHNPVKVAARRAAKLAEHERESAEVAAAVDGARVLADQMSTALGVPVNVRYTYLNGRTRPDGLTISTAAAVEYLKGIEA